MESSELETQVNELETRVERLRSLYDQYFMGIEKLEPLVPKKDVERRLAVLRKEQIKNTGLRFKFQMIVQRYNTFITYWMRISRQIEEGRYKRDVMRAKRRFGIDPNRATEVTDGAEARERAGGAERADAPDEKPKPDAYELPDELELDVDFEEDGEAAPPAPVPRPAASLRSFGRGSSFDLNELGDPFEEVDPFPKPREAVPPPVVRSAMRGDEEHATERKIAAAAPVPPAAPPSPPALQAAARSLAERPPAVRPALSQAPQIRRTTAPDPLEVQPLPGAMRPPLGSAPSIAPRIVPTVGPRPPSIRVPPPTPNASAQPPPPPTAADTTPSAVRTGAYPPIRSIAAPAAGPSLRPPPRAVGDLSDARFGEIYAQYVDTRRKQHESTAAITKDALAKQLGDSTQRLKQKHTGKSVDFEVVVKDGKTILRPVVK